MKYARYESSSSVNMVHLTKKISYNSRDFKFFPGDYFLVHPVEVLAYR